VASWRFNTFGIKENVIEVRTFSNRAEIGEFISIVGMRLIASNGS
jgi:hypothetical protein